MVKVHHIYLVLVFACQYAGVNAFGKIASEKCHYDHITCIDGYVVFENDCDENCENCMGGSYGPSTCMVEGDMSHMYTCIGDEPYHTIYNDAYCRAEYETQGIGSCDKTYCEEICLKGENGVQWHCDDDEVKVKFDCEVDDGQCNSCEGELDLEGYANYDGYLYDDGCVEPPTYSYSYSYDFGSVTVECIDSKPQYTTFMSSGCEGEKLSWGSFGECDEFDCDYSDEHRHLGSKSQSTSSFFTKHLGSKSQSTSSSFTKFKNKEFNDLMAKNIMLELDGEKI